MGSDQGVSFQASTDCIPETESLERSDDEQMVLDESIEGEDEHMLLAQF